MKGNPMVFLEVKKIKILNILFIVLLVPLLANVFGLINYLGNQEVLTHQWESLWTQVSLFYLSFFLIPLIAIIVASLWSVEHRAGLKFIRMSPVNNRSFILSKGLLAFIILSLTQVYFLLLFYLGGRFVCHFPPFNLALYASNIALSLVLAIPILFLLTTLSIKIQSLGGLVLLSGLVSFIGVLLSTQNVLPILSKALGLSYVSIQLNNQNSLGLDALTPLFVFAIVESIIFYKLAKKFLQYEG